MANDTEPRALSAALAAPAFVTRGHGVAMHMANRHVERWAPEANAKRVRSMHTLGFVDRLVAPWVETAQRSASLRLFSQYARVGASEREPSPVSWVFPRPWYQDELDWMAAARQSSRAAQAAQAAPTMLTTRGTYVAAEQPAIAAPPVAMPAALYEYVAPSLSLAASQPAAIPGVGFGGETARSDAYSPLVSLAAVQAAELMSRTVAPLAIVRSGATTAAMTPGLRSVLTSILERAAAPASAGAAFGEMPATRLARMAPELVTPPAPRAADWPSGQAEAAAARPGGEALAASSLETGVAGAASATQVAERYAEQRARIVELQRIAQQAAQRELAARVEAHARAQAEAAAQAAAQTSAQAAAQAAAQAGRAAPAAPGDARAAAAAAAQAAALAQARAAQMTETAEDAQAREAQVAAQAEARAAQAAAATEARAAQAASSAELRAAAERAEAELRQRAGGARAAEAQRQADAQRHAEASEAQRRAEASAAQRGAEAEAERARIEALVAQRVAERTGAQRLHEMARAEAAAHARTPIEARRPEAAGVAPASPQLSAEVAAAIAGLPSELAAILGPAVAQRPERTMQAISELNESLRTVELLARSSAAGAAFEVTRGPRLVMPAGLGGLITAVDRAQAIAERPAMLAGQRALSPLPFAQVADQPAGAPTAAMRAAREVRVPALSWLSAGVHPVPAAPATALAATATASPAALSHVAWADRWLARFAGATPQSLDMITAAAAAAPSARMQALANAAPGVVFVAPEFSRGDLGAETARLDVFGRPVAATAPVASFPSPSSFGVAPGAAIASTGAPAGAPAIPAVPTAASGVPLRLINQPPSEPIRRFDDDAETPDDVFAAISAAASRSRSQPVSTTSTGGAAAPAAGQPTVATERQTFADLVAHAAPNAPGPGLSAQLASSPFAPALRHVLPLPTAASFDVRSLFGAGLGATFLAGLIAPGSQRLEIGAQMLPVWASWAEAPLNLQLAADRADHIDRLVPTFEAAYVAPEAADVFAPRDLAELTRLAQSAQSAQSAQNAESAEIRELRDGGDPASAVSRAAAAAAASDAAAAAAAALSAASAAATAAAGLPAAVSAPLSAPLTTLRSALLSWDLSTTEEPGAPRFVPAAFAAPSTAPGFAGPGAGPGAAAASSAMYRDMVAQLGTTARAMVEAMSLPMLGDGGVADARSAWAAPGMVADRAHAWSVAQERSSSDLALDFVAPELVLAARVFGLGPAEAAQAARLAIAGTGQLGAMASTVDRTFVEAMAIGREARILEAERQQRIAAGFAPAGFAPDDGAALRSAPRGLAADLATRPGAPAPSDRVFVEAGVPAPGTPGDARAQITTAFPAPDGGIAAAIAPTTRAPLPPSTGSAFGIDRPTPRGAFLWPAATVAALGMTAAGSDGQLTMSVAALELLAAQVVAELGTFTALAEADAVARGAAGESDLGAGSLGAGALQGEPASRLGALAATFAGASPAAMAAAAAASGAATSGAAASDASAPGAAAAGPAAWLAAASPALLAARRDASAAEPGEVDVLGAAAAMVPVSRRARFEALYVALSQSSTGRSWSPAARAARALALAGRVEDAPISARERAATAWDVLPVVYANVPGAGVPGAGGDDAAGLESGASAPSFAAAAAMSEGLLGSPNAYVGGFGGQSGGFGGQSGGLGGPRGAVGATSASASRARSESRDLVAPDSGRDAGPEFANVTAGAGLQGLSARAGDSLGSYVSPVAPPSMPREGAVTRAPTAAPEYVRTGGRHGGGEVEIPPWFEAAARKMLADRSGDGISLAELTLVTAAPASHIAASAKGAASPAPSAPSGTTANAQQANAPQIDVEKLAQDVYRDILHQMDIARARNGDPYL